MDGVVVIDDASMATADEAVNPALTDEFIDATTARVHPIIVDALLLNSEPVWSMEEMLESAGRPRRCAASAALAFQM